MTFLPDRAALALWAALREAGSGLVDFGGRGLGRAKAAAERGEGWVLCGVHLADDPAVDWTFDVGHPGAPA
jgi:hypothetical protein